MPLAVSRTASWIALLLVCVSGLGILAQESDPPVKQPTSDVIAPVEKSPLPEEPDTPEEYLEAAIFMADLGRFDFAKLYLAKFLEGNPDEELLLNMRDLHGASTFTRLANTQDLRPLSTQLLDLSNAAFVKKVTDPERINKLLDQLGGDEEQQAQALVELRLAGEMAVPAIVTGLQQPEREGQRDLLVLALSRMGRRAVPAMIASLESPNENIRAYAAQSLGYAGDTSALPYLWYPAASPEELPSVRMAAQNAIAKLLKTQPGEVTSSGAAAQVRKLAEQHFRLAYKWPEKPGEGVILWKWDNSKENVERLVVTQRQASRIAGTRLSRQALSLMPSQAEYQVQYLCCALAEDVESNDWDLKSGPGTVHDLALSAGPDVAGQVVLNSIKQRQASSLVAGIQLLSQVGSEYHWKSQLANKSPLNLALSYPDRRVQFAAAHAIMLLDPDAPFSGSDKVLRILANSLASSNENAGQALVIDADEDRAAFVQGLLKDLSYQAEIAGTGQLGFKSAVSQPSVEMILVHANTIRWGLSETVANFRADSRVAGVPLVIYGPAEILSELDVYVRRYPLVTAIEIPSSSDEIRNHFEAVRKELAAPVLSGEQLQAQAEQAAYWLAKIGQLQRPKLFRLDSVEPQLLQASQNASLVENILFALGAIGSKQAQWRLAEIVVDDQNNTEIRVLATNQLTAHIKKYGLVLESKMIESIHRTWIGSTDMADLHTAIGGLIGSLKPDSELVGRRLRGHKR